LAHAVIELRVADLSVLRLLRRLERRSAVVLLHLALLLPHQRNHHDHRDDADQHDQRQPELHRQSLFGARSSAVSSGGSKPNFRYSSWASAVPRCHFIRRHGSLSTASRTRWTPSPWPRCSSSTKTSARWAIVTPSDTTRQN